jgi:hypothetical protein
MTDAPRRDARRAVFFDVENSSRPARILALLEELAVDGRPGVDLVAMGNWRVVSPDTARLLSTRGATLVHSAPLPGVKDWSDLRIAVAVGIWLGRARSGDTLEIVSDDRAFDAAGDVAAIRGVAFRRVSARPAPGAAAGASRRRSGRRKPARRRPAR